MTQDFLKNGIEYHLTYRKVDEILPKQEVFDSITEALNRAKDIVDEGSAFYTLVEVHQATKGQVINGNV